MLRERYKLFIGVHFTGVSFDLFAREPPPRPQITGICVKIMLNLGN